MSRSSGAGVRKIRRSLGFAPCLAMLSCGAASETSRTRSGPQPRPYVLSGARMGGLRSPDNPMVIGARLLPARLTPTRAWGSEPGGGTRELVGGVRLIAHPDGTVLVGDGQLPAGPWSELEVPGRLGGGVLFSAGAQLWRAPSWAGELRLLAVGSAPIEQVLVGLDRVYLRFGRGTLAGIDPRDGSRLDLGPLPAAPWIASVSALDAWHATAVADLRGVLVTEDAGSTWRPAPQATEPEGRKRGSLLPDSRGSPIESAKRSGVGALALALTDGWPLADGTALVARDGALVRVRLADGFVVEEKADAFPMNPARCHAFSLATPRDRGAFGYTCGERRGPTRIYFWDANESKLVEARRFDEPRQVEAFGNGALAVRGSCQEAGASTQSGGDAKPWCTMSPDGRWSERIVRGAATRLIVLSDGTTAVLHPPVGGDLATARIARIERSSEISRPIDFEEMQREQSRILRLGVWMDGLEERRPGWIGGWVDLSGSVLGVEISLAGQTHLGEAIRDAGSPVVGGRWGFGWPRSRRGFETTDGGMTWTKGIVLPDALPEPPGVQEHVCGPIGCLMDGWLRVGWGVGVATHLEEPESLPRPRAQSASPLRLTCEPSAPVTDGDSGSRLDALRSAPAAPVTRFPGFWHRSGPAIPIGQVGLWAEPSSDFDTQLRTVPFARLYAWGPRDEEWRGASLWQLLWVWPWAARPQVHTSAPVPADWLRLDAARAAMRSLGGWQNGWTVVPGDDADHALLVVRSSPGPAGTRVALFESGRPPAWVHSPNESFEPIEAAARLGGRWYVATSQRPLEPPATVLWTVDGSAAHELARLPRISSDTRRRVRLGRRSDGRAIGVAVEGQPDVNQDAAMWLVGVDADTGEASDPAPLAALNALGAAESALPVCEGDEPGWVLDLPYPASIDIRIGEHWGASLAGATARVRLSASRACVEGVAGSTDREAETAPQELSRGPRAGPDGGASSAASAIAAIVYSANQYFHLRCVGQ